MSTSFHDRKRRENYVLQKSPRTPQNGAFDYVYTIAEYLEFQKPHQVLRSLLYGPGKLLRDLITDVLSR